MSRLAEKTTLEQRFAAIRALAQPEFEGMNQLIVSHVQSEIPLINHISEYIINNGGKRLRPLLLLLVAKALGYKGKAHIEFATAIEFIHTATLLHDDVVDASELRRSNKTANTIWGNEASVLVGDFLYSRASQIIANQDNGPALRVVADASNKLAEGEVRQLCNVQNPDTTEDEYLQVIRDKTATLFHCSTALGAIVADSDDATLKAMSDYGLYLGMAFQITDDIIDYASSDTNMGKTQGDDLAEGKPTLPLIHALRNASSEEAEVLKNAITNPGETDFQKVLQIIENKGGLEYSLSVAKRYAEQARASIQDMQESDYKSALIELISFSLDRTY